MTDDEIAKLPEASAEDHAFVWSLGDINDSVVVTDWKMTALETAVTVGAKSERLPVVVIVFEGMQPGKPVSEKHRRMVHLPLDIAECIAPLITKEVEAIRRNNRARIVANDNPPKEPQL